MPTRHLGALVVAVTVMAVVAGAHVTLPRSGVGVSVGGGVGVSNGEGNGNGNGTGYGTGNGSSGGGFAPRIEFHSGPTGEVWT